MEKIIRIFSLPKRIFKILKEPFKILNIQILELIISFLINILFIKTVNVEFYGEYVYLFSIFSLSTLIFGQLDNFTIRFSNKDFRGGIIQNLHSVILNKLLWFLIVNSIILTYLFLISEKSFSVLILLIVLINFFSIFIGSISTLLLVFNYQLLNSKISLLTLASELLFLIFLQFIQSAYILEIFILIRLLNSTLFFLIRIYYVKKRDIPFSIKAPIKNVLIPWSTKYRKYMIPLTISSLFSYVKSYLPILFLGSYSNFTSVGYFNVLNKIFTIASKLIPNISKLYLPMAIRYKSENINLYKRRFYKFSLLSVLVTVTGSVTLYFLKDLIFFAYSFESNDMLNFGVLIICISLILHSISNLFIFYYFTNTNTSHILFVDFFRTIVVIPISVYLISNYGIKGAFINQLFYQIINVLLFVFISQKLLKRLIK